VHGCGSLRKLVADLSLDKDMLQALIRKNDPQKLTGQIQNTVTGLYDFPFGRRRSDLRRQCGDCRRMLGADTR
jgi:hypothetical protein